MPPRAIADLVADPRYAGPVDGAALVGEAAGGNRLLVRVGLWLDARGRVSRARYRATTCASLIGYAEVACGLAEAGGPPQAIGAERVRAAVAGVHRLPRDRADLVALALSRALERRLPSPPDDAAGAST